MRCRLIRANAEEQVFPDDSFELVITDTALHMIPDWQGAIRAAAQRLAPQGVFAGAVPVPVLMRILTGAGANIPADRNFTPWPQMI